MNKNLTVKEIEEISKNSRILLYGEDSIDENVTPTSNEPSTEKPKEPSPQPLHNYELKLHTPPNKRLENALKIIKTQVKHAHPFLFRNESASMSDIRGGTVLLNAEKEAIRNGFIKKHQLARNKTNVCLWEILEKGYEQLNITPKHFKSKGGYLHLLSVQRIKETYTNRGYKAVIEYQHTNGKLIDLVLQNDSETLCIEVCASRPVSKELINLEKDLASAPYPTKLIFAVTEHSMKKELEKLLLTQKQSTCTVEVKLVGDMIDILEVK